MFQRLTLGFAAFASTLAFSVPASAMQVCRDRHDLAALLASEHQETHLATGLQASVQLLELWVNDDTGSWSILVTHPDGHSCIVATGTAWTPNDMPAVVMGLPS